MFAHGQNILLCSPMGKHFHVNEWQMTTNDCAGNTATNPPPSQSSNLSREFSAVVICLHGKPTKIREECSPRKSN